MCLGASPLGRQRLATSDSPGLLFPFLCTASPSRLKEGMSEVLQGVELFGLSLSWCEPSS